MIIKHTIYILLLALISSSCSTSNSFIQKRKYTKGYYINAFDKSVSTKKNNQTNNFYEKSIEKDEIDEIPLITSTNNKFIETPKVVFSSNNSSIEKNQTYFGSKSNKKSKHIAYDEKCDEIIKKDGTIIEAKVKHIDVNTITYLKCKSSSDREYTISKDDIAVIKYGDGEVEIFDSKKSETNSTSRSNNPNEMYNNGWWNYWGGYYNSWWSLYLIYLGSLFLGVGIYLMYLGLSMGIFYVIFGCIFIGIFVLVKLAGSKTKST